MWQSEEDLIKDLALLNDFEATDPVKPYVAKHSIGRGLKIDAKPKLDKKFQDPRIGEVNDVKEAELHLNDYFGKSKGRGSHFSIFSRERYQLLEQLRLVRPMGSGDTGIESFCRRNRSTDDSSSISDFEKDTDNKAVPSKIFSPASHACELPLRVKAYRKSNLQNNALINGLLLKAKKSSDAKVVSEVEEIFRDAADDENDDSISTVGYKINKLKIDINSHKNVF